MNQRGFTVNKPFTKNNQFTNLEEEKVLKTFETYGPEGRESEEQLGKATRLFRVGSASVLFQGCIHFLPQDLHVIAACQSLCIYGGEYTTGDDMYFTC